MELMQLEMFLTVVEEQSFVKAAARVFRSQPAVSQGIRRLEEELGNSLFARTHKRDLQLTPAGEILYEFASRMIALRNEVLTTFRADDVASAGRICVGVENEVGPQLFPYLIKKFQQRHPKVRVEMVCDQAGKLLSGLKQRKVDFVILGSPPDDETTEDSFLVTPFWGLEQERTVWTVRRRTGRSHYTCEFERIVFTDLRRAAASPNNSPMRRSRKYGSQVPQAPLRINKAPTVSSARPT